MSILEASQARSGRSTALRREHLVLALQLLGTLAILAFVPSNALRAAMLPVWWLVTFGRLSREELALFACGSALFTVLDVMAVRDGAFAFSHPDVLGLPWWEFGMWGFYLLHVRRLVGREVRPARGRFVLSLAMAALFAAAFMIAPDGQSRFLLTAVALAGALFFFHGRNDLLNAGCMLLLGAAVEYAGVWSGLWGYPGSPAGGVPLWFAPMWAGVGLFAGRTAEPALERLFAPGRGNEGMRTRRAISINNSLVHGICNYSCRLCAVNKPGYSGPREFQSRLVTERLIERVKDAAREGVHVRYIANAGDGEPTLHPEFCERMAMFGRMLREWDAPVPAPEVSVVTNGERLLSPGILDTLAENRLSLIVSFPTPEPEAYGEVMVGEAKRGAALLGRVVPGIEAAMRLAAGGRLARLYFHISPPEREIVRRDFAKTVDFLTARARAAGLGEVTLVMFPATSNRAGLVRNRIAGTDMYRDFFRKYDGRQVNGVVVRMKLVLHRFFAGLGEIADLVRAFRFPCIWNANLFIAAGGESICCNDQAVRNPQGSVLTDSIRELVTAKERMLPEKTCAGCDQRPERMTGSPAACAFALAARVRLALAGSGGREMKEVGYGRESVLLAEALPENGVGAGQVSAALPGAGNGPLSRPGRSVRRSRLTEVMRALEERAASPAPHAYRFGAGGEYAIRVASSAADRERAWRLVYQVYCDKGYANPNAQHLWYSLHDALPETTTLLVERTFRVSSSEFRVPTEPGTRNPEPETESVPVAALTLVFDSPMGLPADSVYGREVDALRSRGRRPCEIVSLVSVESDLRRGAEIMKHLFKLAYLTACRVERSTDFLITVNPRHVSFYRRILLLEEWGGERPYGKVGGAPAVLLGLDLETAEERYAGHYGRDEGSFFRFFVEAATEPEIVNMLSAARRPLDEAALRKYFVEDRPLLAEATPEQRAVIEDHYLPYALQSV